MNEVNLRLPKVAQEAKDNNMPSHQTYPSKTNSAQRLVFAEATIEAAVSKLTK